MKKLILIFLILSLFGCSSLGNKQILSGSAFGGVGGAVVGLHIAEETKNKEIIMVSSILIGVILGIYYVYHMDKLNKTEKADLK